MTPRRPPECPDDDEQSERLQEVHHASNGITPVNDPVEDQPATENERDAPRLVRPEEVEVEDDRFEAYLRGPTAFTA